MIILIVLGHEVENIMVDREGNLDLPWVQKRHLNNAICTCPEQHVLLPDGTVILCCMDYGMKHVLGNLLEMDYKDLKREERYELCKRCNRAVEA